MTTLSPHEIISELDRFSVGQKDAAVEPQGGLVAIVSQGNIVIETMDCEK